MTTAGQRMFDQKRSAAFFYRDRHYARTCRYLQLDRTRNPESLQFQVLPVIPCSVCFHYFHFRPPAVLFVCWIVAPFTTPGLYVTLAVSKAHLFHIFVFLLQPAQQPRFHVLRGNLKHPHIESK